MSPRFVSSPAPGKGGEAAGVAQPGAAPGATGLRPDGEANGEAGGLAGAGGSAISELRRVLITLAQLAAAPPTTGWASGAAAAAGAPLSGSSNQPGNIPVDTPGAPPGELS